MGLPTALPLASYTPVGIIISLAWRGLSLWTCRPTDKLIAGRCQLPGDIHF